MTQRPMPHLKGLQRTRQRRDGDASTERGADAGVAESTLNKGENCRQCVAYLKYAATLQERRGRAPLYLNQSEASRWAAAQHSAAPVSGKYH